MTESTTKFFVAGIAEQLIICGNSDGKNWPLKREGRRIVKSQDGTVLALPFIYLLLSS